MSDRIDLDQLEEELANLQDMRFDTRLDERVANANMFNRMLNELARCYQQLDKLEDFLGGDLRSFVNSNAYDHIQDAISNL